MKFLSLRYASRYTSSVCNASYSNSYRRNPDFSKQNKQGFSRNRNRHNEEREGYEDLEESETLSSKNGSHLSFSGNQKFQSTSTPGPREKEIVELFRKVQAQLRERAAMKKEERKVDNSQGKSKESETVDSLLKLLRKHSVQQGKKSNITTNNNNKDFILDNQEHVSPSTEKRNTSIPDSTNHVKHEIQESPKPPLSRPKSNFSKRSPVPEIKFQPVYSEGVDSIISPDSLDSGKKRITLEPEAADIHEVESDSESEVDPLFQEDNVFDEISDDEISEIYESEHEDVAKAGPSTDLSGMKLTELRAVAKSRGMKGFSKLKKIELIELLSRSI